MGLKRKTSFQLVLNMIMREQKMNMKYKLRLEFLSHGMVRIYFNQERFAPGEEIKLAVNQTRMESIQLLSIRCFGYVRLPSDLVKDVPERAKYTFKDKPGGPTIPDDSILVWLSPNFPVHFDALHQHESLVRLFIPYFVPPSIRGSLFEVLHYVEVSILARGEFELRSKRIPLTVITAESMAVFLSPAIGDGYEQFDFSLPPSHQATPHGKRSGGWEALDMVQRKVHRKNASGFFRSRRAFRISFNNHHATEISLHGEWSDDQLVVDEGIPISAHFRFDFSYVAVRRFLCRLVRMERAHLRDVHTSETTMSETPAAVISQYISESSQTIPIPQMLCPSFRSDLVSVSYRLEFELRAQDSATEAWLDPVIWSLPLLVQPRPSGVQIPTESTSEDALPLGSIEGLVDLVDDPEESQVPATVNKDPRRADIQYVKQRSAIHPGSMRFTIHC